MDPHDQEGAKKLSDKQDKAMMERMRHAQAEKAANREWLWEQYTRALFFLPNKVPDKPGRARSRQRLVGPITAERSEAHLHAICLTTMAGATVGRLRAQIRLPFPPHRCRIAAPAASVSAEYR